MTQPLAAPPPGPGPDPTRCPLCGADNRCAMAAGSALPCWCMVVRIDRAQLDRIPPEARLKACLCPGCANATPRTPAGGQTGDTPRQDTPASTPRA